MILYEITTVASSIRVAASVLVLAAGFMLLIVAIAAICSVVYVRLTTGIRKNEFYHVVWGLVLGESVLRAKFKGNSTLHVSLVGNTWVCWYNIEYSKYRTLSKKMPLQASNIEDAKRKCFEAFRKDYNRIARDWDSY